MRKLRPEADQNIVRGLILISVACTKHRVSDVLVAPFSHTQSGTPGSHKDT